MAETELTENSYGCEELLSRHRKEKKQLQAQIQQTKHEVPKGDKKRKKEAMDKVALLEAELQTRQTQEIEEFKKNEAGVDEVTAELETLSTHTGGDDVQAESQTPPKKTSKAQKRREKKAQKDRERNEDIQRQDVENLTGDRHIEAQKLKQKLAPLNLAVHEIHSDGNCLYNAIAHQLVLRGVQEDNSSLREKSAGYMRKHPDDYLPFLCNEDTGDLFTPEEFEEYCNKVETTTTWGGQLELRALSDVLHTPIKVLQGTGPDLLIGEDHKDQPLLLLYYRHAFGLGEHYNSVRTRVPADDEECS